MLVASFVSLTVEWYAVLCRFGHFLPSKALHLVFSTLQQPDYVSMLLCTVMIGLILQYTQVQTYGLHVWTCVVWFLVK